MELYLMEKLFPLSDGQALCHSAVLQTRIGRKNIGKETITGSADQFFRL